MSNTRLGADCCSDRVAVFTSHKCPCGCGLFYCRACYADHCIEIVEKHRCPTTEKRSVEQQIEEFLQGIERSVQTFRKQATQAVPIESTSVLAHAINDGRAAPK